ncbi:MAG: ABC transporter substrate-binding protein [Desulfobacterales bacterium]
MVTDQPPGSRIVSLTPSLTELLFALGMDDRVVGVTDSCDYPEAVLKKPNVLCWFEPDLEKLMALKPDTVLGADPAHRNLKPVLAKEGIRVVLVNPQTVDQALESMIDIGDRFGVSAKAYSLVEGLHNRLKSLDEKVSSIAPEKRLTVCRVVDWYDDLLYVAGPLSFQYDVIARGGGINVTGSLKKDYPKIPFAQLLKWNPEMIFICGYDIHLIPRLTQDHKWRRLNAVQAGRIYQFHCGLTCRTGPRIVDMAELLFQTLYE